ncbi:P-selectin glycoprotein ligand 1 isoform X1 [Cavia porcellus]|uniref:P-selectin glycoprotein ligand 1 isoform X1 n=1 Tax=Cavia porcellus TaxID=10141 RepID=UPI000350BBF1|nr:P-selectin glycoprotein ligand 1 isoform X1 [Cavia porcellus]
MPQFLILLLLVVLLAPLGTASTQEGAAKGAPNPPLSRARRQVDGEDEDYDYHYNTEPPETLIIASGLVTTRDHLRSVGTVGLGTPELPTVESGTELVTQQSPVTVDLATELSSGTVFTREVSFRVGALSVQPAATEEETTQPAPTEAETTQPVPTEAETTQPAPTEAETTQPAPTEAETTQPAPTEAETTQPAPTEAETTQPAPTEAETTQPVPTEAETTQPAPMEAETTQPAPTEAETTQPAATEALLSITVTEALSTESIATVTVSTESDTTEFSSTEPTPTIPFLGHSVNGKDTTVAASDLSGSGLRKGLAVPTGSSMAPIPTEASGRIPVKQCLLAILILALVATIFLVCTVVLAVRLSRKGHTYPVRSYSPTEMVCISSLLPDGGEGAPTVANGGVAKGRDLKAEGREDREGDDLTLHSFLP